MKYLVSVVTVILLMLSIMSYADKADEYFKKGKIAIAEEKYHVAISHFSNAIRHNPDYWISYAERGFVRQILGQYEKAIADFDKVIQIGQKGIYLLGAYQFRATAKNKLGKHLEAIEDCNMALKIYPDNVTMYIIRADAKLELGQYIESIRDHDIAVLKNPDDPDRYIWRGIVKAKSGQYQSAIIDYDIAIKIQFEKAGDHILNLARDVLEIKKEPSPEWNQKEKDILAEAFFHRSVANLSLDKPWIALQDLTKAIEANSDYGIAYFERGKIKRSLGFNISAANDFQKASHYADESENKTLSSKAKHEYRETLRR